MSLNIFVIKIPIFHSGICPLGHYLNSPTICNAMLNKQVIEDDPPEWRSRAGSLNSSIANLNVMEQV